MKNQKNQEDQKKTKKKKKKKGKKNYQVARTMRQLCINHNCIFNDCDCSYYEGAIWEPLTDSELEDFLQTGLIPDYAGELAHYPEDPPPPKVRPEWPLRSDEGVIGGEKFIQLRREARKGRQHGMVS